MKTITKSCFIALLFTVSSASCADSNEMNSKEKFEHGAKTHQNHCYKCHTDKIYTRDDSFVKSLNALGQQVRRCKDSNDAPWFDEDTDAVVHFLNQKYYKF